MLPEGVGVVSLQQRLPFSIYVYQLELNNWFIFLTSTAVNNAKQSVPQFDSFNLNFWIP